jgi:hypothetical protein
MAWVRAQLCKLQKGYTRLAATCDKVYQLLAHGRWFSPGIRLLSPLKLVAMILLKVAINTKNRSMKSIKFNLDLNHYYFLYII